MNDAYKNPLQPTETHVHFHVLPRYANNASVNGVIFKDKEFGRHYKNKWNNDFKPKVLDKQTMRIITNTIKQSLL